MPLEPRADERYHRIGPPPGWTPSWAENQVLLLRKGLRQIVNGDYPAEAGDARTWAAEILANPTCVNWEEEENGSSDSGEGAT